MLGRSAPTWLFGDGVKRLQFVIYNKDISAARISSKKNRVGTKYAICDRNEKIDCEKWLELHNPLTKPRGLASGC